MVGLFLHSEQRCWHIFRCSFRHVFCLGTYGSGVLGPSDESKLDWLGMGFVKENRPDFDMNFVWKRGFFV